jgi:regulator of nonsense transcripts 1
VIAASIVYHLSQIAELKSTDPVLVCATSDSAVEQLAAKIHLTGLRVVIVAAKGREAVGSHVSFLSLDEQVKNNDTDPELRKLILLKITMGELIPSDERKFKKLRAQAECDLLQSSEVICCTCVGAGDPRLEAFTFKNVIIDEATRAAEAETLIPIAHGAQKLILVGDVRQQQVRVLSSQAEDSGFGRSIFSRFVKSGDRPLNLNLQYRMHPCLSSFPNNMLYNGMYCLK